ncbi:hypothetical protein [Flavobacterium sp.]|uniref:hypothetical protein n=1 Tax=Flavobacterium sp. TaxID=239 RepID=UPI003750B852
MNKTLKLLLVSVLVCSCSNYKSLQAHREINVEEVYKSWNKLAKTFTEINLNEIDKNSLRYTFLQELQGQYRELSDYYIIESPISGEFYMPRIWIMYSRNKKSTDVVKFEFLQRKWKFKDSFLLPYIFKYRYKEYIRKNEKEFNYNDVTISHVINDEVVSCDFFIAGSMKKFVFELPEMSNHF